MNTIEMLLSLLILVGIAGLIWWIVLTYWDG